MPVTSSITSQLDEVKTLKMITAAFSETSALKIKSLKKAFEENRIYYDEISQLYRSLKRSAKSQKAHTEAPEKQSLAHPRTIHLAVTSNRRFYGSLNQNIIRDFFESTRKTTDDRIIIGKTGIRAAEELQDMGRYGSMMFSKDDPSKEEVDQLIKKTQDYQRVIVYYPKFLNMFNQTVDHVDITYSPDTDDDQGYELSYIFEPELSQIIEFFELNVRYILFYRVMLETQLARVATRLMAMDQAERKSDTMIADLHRQLRQYQRARINAELLETFSGISKWRNQ